MRGVKVFSEIKDMLTFGAFDLTLVCFELATTDDKAGEAVWASRDVVHN